MLVAIEVGKNYIPANRIQYLDIDIAEGYVMVDVRCGNKVKTEVWDFNDVRFIDATEEDK